MFRFTIRDVLWLTALVAMGAAWWADRARIEKERALLKQGQADLQEIRQAVGGDQVFDEFLAMVRKRKAFDSKSLPPKIQKASPDEN